MKINKSKEQKKNKPEVKIKTILSYSLPYIVFCVLIIIFIGILQYYSVIAKPAKERNQTFVSVTMSSYMELVLSRLDSISVVAQSILTEPSLKQDLQNSSLQRIQEIENNVKKRLDNIIGVRILSSDTQDLLAKKQFAIVFH